MELQMSSFMMRAKQELARKQLINGHNLRQITSIYYNIPYQNAIKQTVIHHQQQVKQSGSQSKTNKSLATNIW